MIFCVLAPLNPLKLDSVSLTSFIEGFTLEAFSKLLLTLVVDRSKLTKKINTDGKAYEKYDPSNLPDTTKDRFAKKSFLDKRLTGLSISEDTTNVRDQFDAVIDGYTNKFDGFKNSLKNTTKDLKENVVHLRNGKYGLVEVKLGGDRLINEGAENLKTLAEKINTEKMNAPSFMMVLTGTGDFAYRRKDGVFVVPIGCLKD